MKHLAFLAALVGVVVMAAAASAAPPTGPPSGDMLKFFGGGAGTIVWTSSGGSSTEDNQALQLSGGTSGTDYEGAYAINATSGGTLLSEFNASFDVKGYEGAGSPRISLPVDVNGDGSTDLWAYLSSSYCTGSARTDAGSGFDHVNFRDPGCTIYTSAPGIVLHGLAVAVHASGTISYPYGGFTFEALDAGWRVATDQQPFLILDEAPAVSYVDDLTIGNHNWQRPGRPGFVADLPLSSAAADAGTMNWTNGAGDSFGVNIACTFVTPTDVWFAGPMANGAGQFAGNNGQVILEHLALTNQPTGGALTGKIFSAGTTTVDVCPTLGTATGLDGPFTFTGPIWIGS
jgi:hypothetical protein